MPYRNRFILPFAFHYSLMSNSSIINIKVFALKLKEVFLFIFQMKQPDDTNI